MSERIFKKQSYWDDVYEVTRLVPEGRVTTYGAIADYLALGSARMVGWALNNCHSMDGIPAHRVVNRKGELSGAKAFNPPTLMQELLEYEGVKVENNTVVNFKELWRNPAEHLGEY